MFPGVRYKLLANGGIFNGCARSPLYVHIRSTRTSFAVPASWLRNVLSLLQQGCQVIGRRDRALLAVREVSFAECFHNFIGIKYVIPVALKKVLDVGVDVLEYSSINVYCLCIPCFFVLICVFCISLICVKSVTTLNLAFLSYWYRKKHLQMHF
jgi:hypothetical protein